MNRWILKTEFANCNIITKNRDGRETLVTKDTFNDMFAQMMLDNNQGHLITENVMYKKDELLEKKTFVELSDTSILLTSNTELIEEKQPKKTRKKQG